MFLPNPPLSITYSKEFYMKKIVSIIALVLSASLLFIGCASAPKDNPYSEENIRKYPLEDYSEVIESKLSQQELFLHTREWIIQNSQTLHESNPLIRHYYNPKEFPTLPLLPTSYPNSFVGTMISDTVLSLNSKTTK